MLNEGFLLSDLPLCAATERGNTKWSDNSDVNTKTIFFIEKNVYTEHLKVSPKRQ